MLNCILLLDSANRFGLMQGGGKNAFDARGDGFHGCPILVSASVLQGYIHRM